MPKREDWYVSKQDFKLTVDQRVTKGQLIRPTGAVNDHYIFGDNTRWTYRYDGRESEAETCGTDGCQAKFVNLGALDRHRLLIHAPERDARERAKREAQEAATRAEAAGETIGGFPIEKVKSGPGGPVPYVQVPVGR